MTKKNQKRRILKALGRMARGRTPNVAMPRTLKPIAKMTQKTTTMMEMVRSYYKNKMKSN